MTSAASEADRRRSISSARRRAVAGFGRVTPRVRFAVAAAHPARRPRARRTSSALALIALDLATGKLRWHYQLVSPDICGYDAASLPVLLDLPGPNKQPVPMLAAASKSGRIYVLNRIIGEPLRRSRAFVRQDAPMLRQPTRDGINVAPGAAGGANWPPAASRQPPTARARVGSTCRLRTTSSSRMLTAIQ